MEELRSTDILDREINEDARRKAEKVLKSSEAECRQILDDVSVRLDAVRKEKNAEVATRLAAFQRDIDASIPLDKERRLVSFIDDSVQKALDAWFDSLSAAQRLTIYSGLIQEKKAVFADADIAALAIGYDESAVRAAAEGVFGAKRISSIRILTRAESSSRSFSDGLVIETVDGAIRCRATKEEIRSILLSEKRQELAETLLGGRLPE